MTVAVNQEAQKGKFTIDITGVASVADGGIGAILNPEGVKLLITRVILYFETGSTGAGNLDVGVAALATTKATDILSAFDGIEATVGGKAFYAVQVPTNEGELTVIWEAGEYITFSGSGSSVGLAAKMYLEYIRLD